MAVRAAPGGAASTAVPSRCGDHARRPPAARGWQGRGRHRPRPIADRRLTGFAPWWRLPPAPPAAPLGPDSRWSGGGPPRPVHLFRCGRTGSPLRHPVDRRCGDEGSPANRRLMPTRCGDAPPCRLSTKSSPAAPSANELTSAGLHPDAVLVPPADREQPEGLGVGVGVDVDAAQAGLPHLVH